MGLFKPKTEAFNISSDNGALLGLSSKHSSLHRQQLQSVKLKTGIKSLKSLFSTKKYTNPSILLSLIWLFQGTAYWGLTLFLPN